MIKNQQIVKADKRPDDQNIRKLNQMRLKIIEMGEDEDGSSTPKEPYPILEMSDAESERHGVMYLHSELSSFSKGTPVIEAWAVARNPYALQEKKQQGYPMLEIFQESHEYREPNASELPPQNFIADTPLITKKSHDEEQFEDEDVCLYNRSTNHLVLHD